MRKEIAESWVKALRSGNYRQGEGHLKKDEDEDGPQHCCLGVLCEMIGYPIEVNSDELLDDDAYKLATMNSNDGELGNPVDYKGQVHTNLAALNDAGAPFSYIATVIDNNWKDL